MKVYEFNNDKGNVHALFLIDAAEILGDAYEEAETADISDEALEQAITDSILHLAKEQDIKLQFTKILSIDEQDDGAVMVEFEAAAAPTPVLGQYRNIPVDARLPEENQKEYLLRTAANGVSCEVPALIVDHEMEVLYQKKAAEVLQDTNMNILTDIYRILEDAVHEITPEYKKDDIWHHAVETTQIYFNNGASDMSVDNMISSVLNVLSKYGRVTDDSGAVDQDLCSRIGVIIESRGKERARLTGESLADQVFDTWLRSNNTTREQWAETARVEAVEQTRVNLMLDTVADVENITVPDEDVLSEIKNLAEEFGISEEEVRSFVSEEAIRFDMKRDRARQLIYDAAVYV